MASVTIQVLEGLERGRIFADLPTPVSIGREDDNAIQLNDERVSRFHAKIQEDGDRVILTDLDSTNGTRVNGHPVQMRVLRDGDLLTIGRCVLVFGRMERPYVGASDDVPQEVSGEQPDTPAALSASQLQGSQRSLVSNAEGTGNDSARMDTELPELFPTGPPDPPAGLRPYQQAEVSDVLAYVHDQLRRVIVAGRQSPIDGDTDQHRMLLEMSDWQTMLRLEMDLAVYLRKIADPNS